MIVDVPSLTFVVGRDRIVSSTAGPSKWAEFREEWGVEHDEEREAETCGYAAMAGLRAQAEEQFMRLLQTSRDL